MFAPPKPIWMPPTRLGSMCLDIMTDDLDDILLDDDMRRFLRKEFGNGGHVR
jgi:hypothetical protein